MYKNDPMLLNKPDETPGRHRHVDRVLKTAAKPILCEAFFLIRTLCCLEVPYLSYKKDKVQFY